MRRLGLFLSAAAILFIAFVLPLHHHDEALGKASQTHCSVCHLRANARATTTTPNLETNPYVAEETAVLTCPSSTRVVRLVRTASPRAPPSA